jgi:hypothetical protein
LTHFHRYFGALARAVSRKDFLFGLRLSRLGSALCFLASTRLTHGLLLLVLVGLAPQATAQRDLSYEELVQQAYVAYYGRPGDLAGIQYWTTQLAATNGNLNAIIAAFGHSEEFQDRFGNYTEEDLVDNIYQQLLGRGSDPDGLAFYVANLRNGTMTLATIALNIADGALTGSDDYRLIRNKLRIAQEFTTAVADSQLRYSLAEIDNARLILDAVSPEPTSLNIARNLMTLALTTFPRVATPDSRNPSVARLWSEVLLTAIRNDLARPTVHARNLFHVSAAMYDAWSAYDPIAGGYLLGNQSGDFQCALEAFTPPPDTQLAREEAISYAAYRLITHRFSGSPGSDTIRDASRALMSELDYMVANRSTDYSDGSGAALGNYLADCYIDYGFQDGANEEAGYENADYTPVNPPIEPELPGNPTIIDLDRWQSISLSLAIDQSGNELGEIPSFVGAEWGRVAPFALTEADRTVYNREGVDYTVYMDPGPPPTLSEAAVENYQWGFSLVSIWSSHLDPQDGVMIDISPASIGNIGQYPIDIADYPQFYDYLEGGDPSQGYPLNPVTGAPYEPQIVPRADYARVLAEFWADGPDSETPPGHWFVILNEVSEHPDFDKRIGGSGPKPGPLEWDVKAYFTLGGAMHDSAIAAWSIKGWYDYLRPVSAIRAMGDRGQSTNAEGASYSPNGLPLVEGYIELVQTGDPLAGDADENVGKIKLFAWRGPDFIQDPASDRAGVDWILAENWWPYQRPSFVTPPFAGYVSGHSTYSRAAAEVLTALTGSEYFPGGLGRFDIPANNFLVFEQGPSVDISLQWVTYRDASDQTSLSRIWGGIHPPADDIPGRLMGEQIGQRAFTLAQEYINGQRKQ